MQPNNVSAPSAVLQVWSTCVQRTHGFQGSPKIPEHGPFRSLSSAALRALLEVLLTYPGLASGGCEQLSCHCRDLQGRKSGSTDALARLFREGCTELLRFPLFGPPQLGSLGGGCTSSPAERDLRWPEVAPLGSAVISVSVNDWAAQKRSRADLIARVSSRVRCKRRPPRCDRECFSFSTADTMILLASLLTSMFVLTIDRKKNKQRVVRTDHLPEIWPYWQIRLVGADCGHS